MVLPLGDYPIIIVGEVSVKGKEDSRKWCPATRGVLLPVDKPKYAFLMEGTFSPG
jgi:hypothetical protein